MNAKNSNRSRDPAGVGSREPQIVSQRQSTMIAMNVATVGYT
jgi:hypothetical protein